MTSPYRVWILCLLLSVAPACDEGGEVLTEDLAIPLDNRFAAEAALPGAHFGGLEVISSDLRQSEVNSVYVGWVQFAGQVVVSGVPKLIENDGTRTLCFMVDEESAEILPRLRHDERKVWFCFEDQERALRLLESRLELPTRLMINDYRTVYEFTDAHDTASLVGVVPGAME